MPSVHFKLSPSAAHRWLICPGEPRMRAAVPPRESEYAKEGTTAHWVAEAVIMMGTKASDLIGKKCPETGLIVTEEMAEAVQIYVDYAAKLNGDVKLEVQFQLGWIHPDLGGTSDLAVLCRANPASSNVDTLHVLDYKHGKGVIVSPEWNPQLMIYALGALYKYANDIGIGVECVASLIKLHIVQPRAFGTEDFASTWEIGVDELLNWERNVLTPAVAATEEEDPTILAGVHCRFCPACAVCPAYSGRMMALAQRDNNQIALPAAAQMTPEQIVKVLESAELLATWKGEIEEYALARAQEGMEFPGMKLVEKIGNRKWADPVQAEEALVGMLGDNAFNKSLVSPAVAEKALGKGRKDIVNTLTVRPVTGVALVPESDKRPALETSRLAQFKTLLAQQGE